MTNINNFISNSSKTPLQKLVDNVVNTTTSGLQASVSTVSKSISQTLFNAGISYDSVSSISANKADSTVAAGSADYHLAAGSSPDRISESDLISNRAASSMSGMKYSTERAPTGAIAASSATGFKGDIYPPELHNSEYYIQLNFKSYERPAPFVTPKLNNTYSVVLPIPADLRETYGVDWNTNEQLGVVGDIVNAFDRGRNNVDGGFGLPEGVAYVLRNGVNSASELAGLGDQAASISTVVEQSLGIAPNPNITTSFQGPRFRDSHQFSWIFAPKTKEESELIQRICKTIKNKMLPRSSFSHNAAVLSYPDMLQIQLYPENKLYDFKLCVVTNVSYDYSINGVPSFFKDSKLPTMIRLSISAQEIEYYLSEDDPSGNFEEIKAKVDESIKSFTSGALQNLSKLSEGE